MDWEKKAKIESLEEEKKEGCIRKEKEILQQLIFECQSLLPQGTSYTVFHTLLQVKTTIYRARFPYCHIIENLTDS